MKKIYNFQFSVNPITGKYKIRAIRGSSSHFLRSFFEMTLIEATFEYVKG